MKTSTAHRGAAASAQGGVASLELALILLFTFVMLPAVLLFARVFIHYSVLKGATRDAATYMATLPSASIRNGAELQRHEAIARRLIIEAAEAAGITTTLTVATPRITCDGEACLDLVAPPLLFGAEVTFKITDPATNYFTARFMTENGNAWRVAARSVAPFSN